MKTSLPRLLKDYENYHRTRGNHVCHFFGIPMITIALLGELSRVPILHWNAGLVLWLAVAMRFVYLDWKIGIPFAAASLGLYFIGTALTHFANAVLFILGWILQLVGHSHYEKNRPAFVKNLQHLLIGPVWVFLRCTKRLLP